MNKKEFIEAILFRIKRDLMSPNYHFNKPKLILTYPLFTLLKEHIVNYWSDRNSYKTLFSTPIRIMDSSTYAYYIYTDSGIFNKKQETMIVDTFEEEKQ